MVDQVAERLAVARAAARVGVQDDVAGGGVELDLGREAGAVVGERAAVDLEDQRILCVRSKPGGFAIQPWMRRPS